jgi:hypothetical protein
VLRDPAMETLKVEPYVRNLRDNPLFKALLRKMNPPEQAPRIEKRWQTAASEQIVSRA